MTSVFNLNVDLETEPVKPQMNNEQMETFRQKRLQCLGEEGWRFHALFECLLNEPQTIKLFVPFKRNVSVIA